MSSPHQTLPDWLRRRAATMPERIALLAGDTNWTFAELDQQVERLARQLIALGIQPGDRVAVLLQNSPKFVTMVHAMPRCGAVLVPLNTRLTPHELVWQLNDASPRLVLYDQSNAGLADQVHQLQPDFFFYHTDTLDDLEASDQVLNHTIALNELHTIIYTSGTTGKPKGAMLTYGNHWWSATASMLNLGLHNDDRWLAVLPLFHVGGLSILLRSVIYGIPVVLHESFDAALVNRSLEEHQVTIISVVSTMLQRMLDQQLQATKLRCVLLGGGPAPRPLLESCNERGIPVAQTYGMTETASQVATLAPHDALRKLGSAGQPLLPLEVQIDIEGESAAAGQVGEILVRGPMVTAGYFNRPEATAEALRDGWLHTGDLGYLDSEEYLYVVDRRDDIIISGGENVYPAEVEEVLLAVPAVAEAGVIGIPDEQWGQVPVACVVLHPGAELDETAIIAFCRERLARYKTPHAIHMVASLPRTAAGKLRRGVLRIQMLDNK
ncbi:MAG: o-succinylbenzoate--CoA ligase [Chloroflexota bacterium]